MEMGSPRVTPEQVAEIHAAIAADATAQDD
jgi:hypothetical protein